MKSALWPRWYKPAIYQHNPAWMVIDAVARDYGITSEDIRGTSRRVDIVDARRVVARALRQHGLPFSIIGRMLGGRDHRTIMHLNNTFAEMQRCRPFMADCLLRVLEGAVNLVGIEPPKRKRTTRPMRVADAEPVAATDALPEWAGEADDIELLSRRVAAHYARLAA